MASNRYRAGVAFFNGKMRYRIWGKRPMDSLDQAEWHQEIRNNFRNRAELEVIPVVSYGRYPLAVVVEKAWVI